MRFITGHADHQESSYRKWIAVAGSLTPTFHGRWQVRNSYGLLESFLHGCTDCGPIPSAV